MGIIFLTRHEKLFVSKLFNLQIFYDMHILSLNSLRTESQESHINKDILDF